MPRLEIKLFGPPRILLDGREFDTERRKAIALLAYLAVEAKDQPREHLASVLWPDYDRERALAYLRRELYEIGSRLGKQWLPADRRMAGPVTGAGLDLDTRRFENALAASRTAFDPEPDLREAIQAYQGDFMLGFYLADTPTFEEWQRQQAEIYRRDYADALERLAALLEQRGDWPAALESAHSWLALDQLNESAHRALMRIYAGMGDRSRAARQFEDCKRTLSDELGVQPQAETSQLYERILHDRFDAADRSPPPDAPGESPGSVHLPVWTTPFIGRRPELEQIKELIRRPDNRVVTLFGPGGTGKTRLSIQAGSELDVHFPDGIWFAGLAPVESPEALVPEIAKALGFAFQREDQAPRRQLLDYLRQKRLLLILDNVEQLAGAETAGLLIEILTAAEGVKILATTRARLNLPGEQIFNVSGMRLPEPDEAALWSDPVSQARPFSAIQLFVERARRVQPGFVLTGANAGAVAAICKSVHGLPLGIELAASWLELLPPEDIVVEIKRSMDFLETDRPDVPVRQRSMRAVFDYSWKLLNEIEKEAFLSLTVFVGTFSSEASRQVSGASLRILLSLANKAWLQLSEEGRFQIHPLLQHYGAEKLHEDPQRSQVARGRHADYFAGLAAGLSLRIRGAGQIEAVAEFGKEFTTNIRAAWDWLVEQQRWQDLADKMALGLFQFGTMQWRGEELIAWMRATRARFKPSTSRQELIFQTIVGTVEISQEENWNIKETRPDIRLKQLWQRALEDRLEDELGLWFVLLARLYTARNQSPEGEAKLVAAVERIRQAGDPWLWGTAVLIRGAFRDDAYTDLSEKLILEALEVFQGLGTDYELGNILSVLGGIAHAKRRPIEEVADLYHQAQQRFLKVKDINNYGAMFWSLAMLYANSGQAEQSLWHFQEMRRVFEQLGNQAMVGMSYSWEALAAVRFSTFEYALDIRQRGLDHNRKYGVAANIAWDEYELGEIYRLYGFPEKAREQVESARLHFEQSNVVLGLAYVERTWGDLAMAAGRTDEALERFRQYRAYAAADNHSWSLIHAEARIAWALAHQGEVAQTRAILYESLARLQEYNLTELEFAFMLVEARCLFAQGEFTAAAALTAFLRTTPLSWNETRNAAELIWARLAELLAPEALLAAEENGKGRQLSEFVAGSMQRSAPGLA